MDRALYEKIWQRKSSRGPLVDFEGSRTDAAFRLLPEGAGSLLDVGCGDGFFLDRARTKIARVAGLDFSETALAAARERGFEVRACDLSSERYPFDDASFDVVTTLDTIEHVFDIRHMMAEMARVLGSGGTLILGTPNIQYLPYLRSLAGGRFPRTSGDAEGYDGGHIHYFTYRNIEYEMERVGLKPIGRYGFRGGKKELPAESLARFILPSRRYLEFFSPGLLLAALKP